MINGSINGLKVISVGKTRTVIVDERGLRGETRFLMAKGIGLCLLAKDRISREIEYEAVVFPKKLRKKGQKDWRSFIKETVLTNILWRER